MNTARGLLAEFLVARALSASQPVRKEWAAYDVVTPAGQMIEVKSSGFFQSWGQAVQTRPVFSLTGAKEVWDEESGKYLAGQERQIDAWVFALQACSDPRAYDPLNIDQWLFYVLSARKVEALAQKTARLSTIERIGGPPVAWSGLAVAVATVF